MRNFILGFKDGFKSGFRTGFMIGLILICLYYVFAMLPC